MHDHLIAKRCRKCGQVKTRSDFDRGHKDSLFQTCRQCRSEYMRKAPAHYENATEKMCCKCKQTLPVSCFRMNPHKNGKMYFASRCSPCSRSVLREWAASERGRTACKSSTLARMYGISLQDYDRMFADQEGRCYICKAHASDLPIDKRTGRRYNLAVDHCHRSGKVRALLCPSCNNGLGCFKDSIQSLHAAIKYLENKG